MEVWVFLKDIASLGETKLRKGHKREERGKPYSLRFVQFLMPEKLLKCRESKSTNARNAFFSKPSFSLNH